MLRTRTARIISWILFACCFAGACVFVGMHIQQLTNSDMAGDLLRAQLLAEEGKLFSENWYYSTELYSIHTYLIFAPFFHLTQNWHVIRVAGTVVCYALLMASLWFLCREAKLKHLFPLAGAFFLLPLSDPYFDNIIKGVHYIPYVACAFFIFGLLMHSSKPVKAYRLYGTIILAAIVSFMIGLGGMRMVLTFYIPIACTAALLWPISKRGPERCSRQQVVRFTAGTGAAFMSALLGCMLNTAVLSKRYSFRSYADLQFTDFSLERLLTVFQDWLNFWGYRKGPVFSITLLHNVVALLLIGALALALIRCIKNRETPIEHVLLSVFYAAACLIYFALFAVTDVTHFETYHLPISVFGLLLAATSFMETQTRLQKAVAWILAGAVVLCGAMGFAEMAQKDSTQELREIAEYLVEDEYEAGYATFWSGNVMTELSNGELEMYVWLGGECDNIDQTYKWLQRKSHDTQTPEGPVFVLMERKYLGVYAISSQLSPADQVYETENYLVYGYDDYETMKWCMEAALEETEW
ncbi:MAG: hypothetical protein IKJ26_07580 [Clostridia bacterium]|nr:hypothetical protein [Clostridia bacterium]